MARISWILGAAVLFGLVPGIAAAQDVAAADALFKRGVTAMKSGDLETACPAIAESQRLDPHPGTLFTLAECENKRGHVATAVVHYASYLNQVGNLPPDQRLKHEERRKLAAQKQTELGPRVPRLTLSLPASAPAGTEVRRDGTALGSASLGMALPVDPGPHTILVRTSDGRERELKITLAPAEQRSIEVTLPEAAAAEKSAPPPPKPPPAAPAEGSSSGKTAAYVIGGLGLAALAVGGVTGALVFSKKSAVSSHCVDVVCDSEGKKAADSAKTLGLVSTIGVGVGLAGIATSTVLFLTGSNEEPHPSALTITPAVTLSSALLSANGSFLAKSRSRLASTSSLVDAETLFCLHEALAFDRARLGVRAGFLRRVGERHTGRGSRRPHARRRRGFREGDRCWRLRR